MRGPAIEPYAWEPAEQRGWNSEQGRLSSQPSLRETSAASAPEPPRVRVAGAAIENNRVCMLQERAETMAQASSMGALPENAARKAGAEGAYGRSVISSRRRLQVADGYGFQPPLP